MPLSELPDGVIQRRRNTIHSSQTHSASTGWVRQVPASEQNQQVQLACIGRKRGQGDMVALPCTLTILDDVWEFEVKLQLVSMREKA